MKIILGPRQAGKTEELLRLAHEHFAYLVCPSRQRVADAWRRAQCLGLNIPMPITWEEFTAGRYRGKGINGFIIDDLDDCMRSMTMAEIIAVSMTGSTT